MMSCVPSFRISLHLGAQQAASNTAPATRRILRGPLGVLSTAGISPSPKLASVASTARRTELSFAAVVEVTDGRSGQQKV